MNRFVTRLLFFQVSEPAFQNQRLPEICYSNQPFEQIFILSIVLVRVVC